jgi:hypothetical protein
MESTSEVAKLREHIRLSYEAAQRAMNDPAMVGSHDFITARMENMQQAHTSLIGLVGEDEAMKIVAQTIEPTLGETNKAGAT